MGSPRPLLLVHCHGGFPFSPPMFLHPHVDSGLTPKVGSATAPTACPHRSTLYTLPVAGPATPAPPAPLPAARKQCFPAPPIASRPRQVEGWAWPGKEGDGVAWLHGPKVPGCSVHGGASGLDSGQSGEGSSGCLLWMRAPHSSCSQGLSGIGSRWEACPMCGLELEDEVGRRRPSGQGSQHGGDSNWLGCFFATPPSVFACPQPLLQGWGGWVGGAPSMSSGPDCVSSSCAYASTCCLEGQPSGNGARTYLHCVGYGAPRCGC